MELKVRFNPYTANVSIFEKTNGEWSAIEADWIDYLSGKMLPTWFQAASNWSGFCTEAFRHMRTKELTFHFEGREIDFLDFKELCREYNGRPQAAGKITVLEPERFFFDDRDVMDKLEQFKNDLLESKIKDKQIRQALAAYEECKNDEFAIAVIAPMSSGKSTLINALLRKKLIPYGNKATTAKVTYIHDGDDGQQQFTYKCFDGKGKALPEFSKGNKEATPEELDRANKDPKVHQVDLYGDIAGISGKGLHLTLLDTPGPNNSAVNEHRQITYSVIHDEEEKHPIILFVLDATKLEVNDEFTLLKEIADVMNESKQSQDRFIFVLNKADELDPENGETISDFTQTAKQYLEDTFHLPAPRLIPVTAQTALWQFLQESNELSPRIVPLLLGKQMTLKEPACDLVQAATLSPEVCRKVEAERARAIETKDEAALTIVNSGIYGLELTISEYLEKYARPYKIQQCLNAMRSHLKSFRSSVNFEQRINEDKAALAEAQSAQEALTSKKEQLSKGGEAIREKSRSLSPQKKILDDAFDNTSRVVQRVVNNFMKSQNTEIEEKWVNSIITDVDSKIKENVKDCSDKLLKDLESQMKEDFGGLYKDCETVLAEFKEKLRELPGLDVDSLWALDDLAAQIQAQNNYSFTSYISGSSLPFYHKSKYKTVLQKNPERGGLLGFFKFWEPQTISVPQTGTFIDRENLAFQITHGANTQLRSNFNSITKGLADLYEEKKALLLSLVTYIDEGIQQISDDLQEQIERAGEKGSDLALLEAQKAALDNWLDILARFAE